MSVGTDADTDGETDTDGEGDGDDELDAEVSKKMGVIACSCAADYVTKPRPEPPALAFQNPRPGQSRHQAVSLAWPWLGLIGPGLARHITNGSTTDTINTRGYKSYNTVLRRKNTNMDACSTTDDHQGYHSVQL